MAFDGLLKTYDEEKELAQSLGIQLENAPFATGFYSECFRGKAPDGTILVLKFLKEDPEDGSTLVFDHQLMNFLREAHIGSSIRHPNIMDIRHCVQEPPCLIMKFLPGGTLRHFINQQYNAVSNGQVSPAQALLNLAKMLSGVACGMMYLHGQPEPILHRDLTSLNILIDEDGTAKISDFGLSKPFNPNVKSTWQRGNMHWVAPEALMGDITHFNPACDVYSFGIIVWEVCTLKPPYAGVASNMVSLAERKRLRWVPEPSDFPPGTPETLIRLTRACMDPEPSKRPNFDQIYKLLSEFYEYLVSVASSRSQTNK